ncbi:MAG: FAD:protein FMN transferase [Bacteroidota bacterium]|nr:FAD:protein FMN transferase [Bacteroidota bacterium]
MKVFKSYRVIFLIFLVGCTPQLQVQQVSGYALGTTYNITYFDTQLNPYIPPALDSIFYVLNKSMSTYIKNSDISKINRGDEQVVVDHHFTKVFDKSKEVFAITKGFFDPTVGSLVNAYGFGPEQSLTSLTTAVRDSLLNLTGLAKVTLTEEGLVKKTNPNIYLDFNAIGKGYAVDVISSVMDNQFGYSNTLVEIGGELHAKGKNILKNSQWTVAIDAPNLNGDDRELLRTLKLENQALATSGNYRKFRIDEKGNKYVHTINPFDGTAQPSKVLSASVIAADCMTADAYATAFMSMPITKIEKLSLDGIEYMLVLAGDNGNYDIQQSPGFPSLNLP